MASRAGRGLGFVVLVRVALATGLAVLPARAADRELRGASCEPCHASALTGGHPVRVIPVRAVIPRGWPLDAGGRIGCRTCHQRCGSTVNGMAFIAPERRGLRSAREGREFCAECHRSGARPASVGPRTGLRAARGTVVASAIGPSTADHSGLLSLAHPSVTAATSAPGALDAVSEECLGCHDGTVATTAETVTAPGIGGVDQSHPLGLAYPPAPRRGHEGTFRPLASLDPRLVLTDGRIGCLTCHDVYSGQESLLVMPNDGSRLCYSCHEI